MPDARDSTMPSPPLTFVMELRVGVGTPMEIGNVAGGRRRVIPILGGAFAGPGVRGAVLEGGADWQIVRPDGFTELDTRYLLRTDEGELIYIRNPGVRHAAPEVMRRLLDDQVVDPSLVYFRTAPAFETAAPRLQWLTRSLFVGAGERHPSDVIVRVWMVG
jgi:hypothetical protein